MYRWLHTKCVALVQKLKLVLLCAHCILFPAKDAFCATNLNVAIDATVVAIIAIVATIVNRCSD